MANKDWAPAAAHRPASGSGRWLDGWMAGDNCPRDGGLPVGIKSRREAERCVPGGGLSTAAAEQLTAEVLLGGIGEDADKQIKANALATRHLPIFA